MANSKGPSSMRSMVYHGKSSLLPPKSPFPSISSLYGDYAPRSAVPQRGTTKARDGNSLHQRTSSESCLIEEQPSWLDDLLNEPETPVRRGGHRRSSSDSFAYSDAASLENFDYIAQDDNNFRNITPVASWGSQDFDYYVDARHATSYVGQNSLSRNKNRARDACSTVSHSRDLPSSREHFTKQSTGSSCPPQERDRPKSAGSEKQYLAESGTPDPKGSVEEIDSSRSKASASESDSKRAKQQFAQRSRVRKLQYIAELERNVQALQAEGSEVSAELEFLNQQTLILSMENKALKQRLENLAQEKLIKYLEHEVLERERARLRALYQQQQQQPQQPCSNHRRSTSKDLDQQFASLSLKYEASSARDPVPGQLHILP